jgi:serine/threonine protein kinase
MIGKLLDRRYQVIQVLSAGGFGETYIAQDTRRPGNPTCVVKLLKPASNDPDYLQTVRRLFKSEAETLEQLGNHDQIPRLLAYFEENEQFYLVQEFIVGQSLATELQPGRYWTESQVIDLLKDVLGILAFVHSYGVIHRDLKPGNLIRRASDGKLVLIDFGAVKQFRTQIAMEPTQMPATVAIGTPGYMPSEQGTGRPRPNSDIYALGIIAIQALTQLYPTQLSEDNKTGEILWQPQAQVSAGLASIISKMVRYDYRTRYQSATEVLQALDELTLVSSVPPTQLPSNPPLPVAPTQRLPVPPPQSDRVPVAAAASNKFPWLLGGSLAAIVGAVAAIAFVKSTTSPPPLSQNPGSNPEITTSLDQDSIPNPSIDVTASPDKGSSSDSTAKDTTSPDKGSSSDSTAKDTSSPQNTTPTSSSNEFDKAQFPQSTCGDSLPTGSSSSIEFHPVFIQYSESSLQTVKSNFCADAYKTTRRDSGEVAIQVASFTDRRRAESFSDFMNTKVGSGDVGQPTIYSANSNTDTSSQPDCSIVVSDPEPPLNVRSAPDDTLNNVVGTLENDTPLTVITEQKGWLQISSPVQGWISKNRTKNTCQ